MEATVPVTRFFIKLQAEKIHDIRKKTPVTDTYF